MADGWYYKAEIGRVLNGGPSEGDDFFRMKFTGKNESRWMNCTREQLQFIMDYLSVEKGVEVPDGSEHCIADDHLTDMKWGLR